MKLKGKCKKDFRNWYLTECHDASMLFSDFRDLHPSMQFGTIQDFGVSQGFVIDIQPVIDYDETKYTEVNSYIINVIELNKVVKDTKFGEFDSLDDAREAAVDKFVELYNK